jgi:hypothetical protein
MEQIFKRKFRWTAEGTFPTVELKPTFVKVSQRPSLPIEGEPDHLPDDKPPQLTTTFIDVGAEDASGLYKVLGYFYDKWEKHHNNPSEVVDTGTGTLTLRLYDGVGNEMENWVLKDVWPTHMNFGELDYSSSDLCTVEVTWRYKDFVYQAMPLPEWTSVALTPNLDPDRMDGVGLTLGQLGMTNIVFK